MRRLVSEVRARYTELFLFLVDDKHQTKASVLSAKLLLVLLVPLLGNAEAPPAAPPVKVLGVKSDKELVTIAQDPVKPWKLGERVCMARGQAEMACGEVVFVGPQSVTVKLASKEAKKGETKAKRPLAKSRSAPTQATEPRTAQKAKPLPAKTAVAEIPTVNTAAEAPKTNAPVAVVAPPTVTSKVAAAKPKSSDQGKEPTKTASRESASISPAPAAPVLETTAKPRGAGRYRILVSPSLSFYRVGATDHENASSATLVSSLSPGLHSQLAIQWKNVGDLVFELHARNYSLSPPADKVFLSDSSLLIGGAISLQRWVLDRLKLSFSIGFAMQAVIAARNATTLSIDSPGVPSAGLGMEVPLVSASKLALAIDGNVRSHFSASASNFMFRNGLSLASSLIARYSIGGWLTQASLGYTRFNANTSIVSQTQDEFFLQLGGGYSF